MSNTQHAAHTSPREASPARGAVAKRGAAVQERVSNHFERTAGEFDAIYTGAGKSGLARRLDRLLRADMYERLRMTIEACGEPQGKRILDVGCGSGRFMIPLAERGALVTGLDPAPSMLRIAEALADARGVRDRCTFVTGDVQSFQPEARFDIVLGVGLFDYLADPQPALARMMELANARTILTFPCKWTWRAPVRKLRLGLRGCPVFFYTRRRVHDLVESAGGFIEQIERIGKIYFVSTNIHKAGTR